MNEERAATRNGLTSAHKLITHSFYFLFCHEHSTILVSKSLRSVPKLLASHVVWLSNEAICAVARLCSSGHLAHTGPQPQLIQLPGDDGFQPRTHLSSFFFFFFSPFHALTVIDTTRDLWPHLFSFFRLDFYSACSFSTTFSLLLLLHIDI